jgi:rare lipoprotein A
LACGLLLLQGSSPVWAATRKPSAKPAAAKKNHKTPTQRGHGRGHRPASPSSEVVAAELIDADAFGMHGAASFYGSGFQGRRTATGERFDVQRFTAASNHFPLGSMVAVRRLDNGRCAIVKVNDRMHAKHRRRVIDVSRGAAEYLDMIRAGVVLVRVAALKAGPPPAAFANCQAAFEAAEETVPVETMPRLPEFGGG